MSAKDYVLVECADGDDSAALDREIMLLERHIANSKGGSPKVSHPAAKPNSRNVPLDTNLGGKKSPHRIIWR